MTEQHRLLFLRVPNGGGKGATVSGDLMAGVMFLSEIPGAQNLRKYSPSGLYKCRPCTSVHLGVSASNFAP